MGRGWVRWASCHKYSKVTPAISEEKFYSNFKSNFDRVNFELVTNHFHNCNDLSYLSSLFTTSMASTYTTCQCKLPITFISFMFVYF